MKKDTSESYPINKLYSPPGMTREEYVSSPLFVKDLNEAMNEAIRQAVAEHHAAGRSVWASVNGKWQEIPPPQKARNK